MERIWHGPFYTWPFLYIGSLRRIMFLASGRDIAFTIENYAYIDGHGRETFALIRRFELPRSERFDEWLIYSERCRRLIVLAGTHQHLAVELDAAVEADGALFLRTRAQRVYLPLLRVRFPRWFSGTAEIRESYNRRAGYFEIDVHIANSVLGPIFGYRGWFQLEWTECSPDRLPPHARPLREQRVE